MRVLLHLRADHPIELPVNYQEQLIGFMYSNISDESYRTFLHEQGYTYRSRTYKHFAFSRILGESKYIPSRKAIVFSPAFSLLVASPLERFLQEFARSMLFSDHLRIGPHRVRLESFETLPEPNPFPDAVRIRMLSPIVIYSTLSHPNGTKYTYYYSPYHEQFSSMIETNLKRRYLSLYPDTPHLEQSPFNIRPLQVNKKDKVITRFRGIIIEGWMGEYEVTGDPRLLGLAYHTCLGSKGSQGFGVFELI